MPPLPSSSPTGSPSRTTSQNSPKKPIPAEKLARARELYEKVEQEWRRSQFEQQLQNLPSQSTMAHGHDGNFLNVPITPLRLRSRSTTSRSSRASATSSAEVYEDLSQMTSVISFDDGLEHREHHRNPLQPYERAKAHLVRHLEACPKCRLKKVRCSLDHHDISSLKNDRDSEVKFESVEFQQPSFEPPPSLRVDIPPSRSISPAIDSFGYELMPSNPFEYMGSAPELLQGVRGSYAPRLDLTQSAVDLDPFSSPVPNLQASPDLQGSPNPFDANPYAGETFSDRHVLNEFCLGQRQTVSQFGITTHTYTCINCAASFPELDQCILHFGSTHIPFNPITPPLRLVCPTLRHFQKYSELKSCTCQGSMGVFIYGQWIESYTPNEQPSSAISNNSYGSSSHSGGGDYNQSLPHYESPPWSSNQYNIPYGGCNQFQGSGGSSGCTGYRFAIVCSPHTPLTCKYKSTYSNAAPPLSPTSDSQTTRHYSQTKSTVTLDHCKARHLAYSRDYYHIPKDHWMFRYQPYFRAASIVSFTLSAMFFGFGHAGDGHYLDRKLAALGHYIREIANDGRLAWYSLFAFCCLVTFWFVRHIWGRRAERRQCPANQQCALLKITIPLTRLASGITSKPSSTYWAGGSPC